MTDNNTTPDPLAHLANEVAEAKAQAEQAAAQPVTVIDVAAAAFIALETLTKILKPEDAETVINAYQERRQQFLNNMPTDDDTPTQEVPVVTPDEVQP